MLAFVDYDYNAKTNTFKAWPKIPNAWSYLGSRVKVKDGNVYLKVTKSAGQRAVDLDNNSASALAVELYVQTDASPSSVTGTTLSWSYDSANGRVKLYGSLAASATQDITINF